MKKIDAELTEAKNAREALNFMWMGFSYFLITNTKTTIAVVLIVLLAVAFMFRSPLMKLAGFDFDKSKRHNIEQLKK